MKAERSGSRNISLLYSRPRARVCLSGLLLVFQQPLPEEGQTDSNDSEYTEH